MSGIYKFRYCTEDVRYLREELIILYHRILYVHSIYFYIDLLEVKHERSYTYSLDIGYCFDNIIANVTFNYFVTFQ